MNRNDFSPAQKDAIDSACNVFVSASAGSGKTTVMIQRIFDKLGMWADGVHGGASLKEIAVLTFTAAAAADMKDKLSLRLEESTAAIGTPEFELLSAAEKERMVRLDSQRPLLMQADISTIHSFCQRLSKKYFYFAETDPGFELMDEAEQEVALSEAISEAIAEEIEKGDAVFFGVYESLLRRRKDNDIKELVRRIYEYAFTLKDPDGWLDGCTKYLCADGEEEIRRELEKVYDRRRRALFGFMRAYRDECKRVGYKRNETPADKICGILSSYDSVKEFIGNSGGKIKLPAGNGSVGAGFENFNADFLELKKKCEDFLKDICASDGFAPAASTFPTCDVLARLAKSAAAKYRAEKSRLGKADYNDLEQMAYKVLHSQAAAEIAATYKYVFVDEYQDVNPIQEAIISALSKKPEIEARTVGDDEEEAATGKLFAVGDVKQSIYAFRGCRPDLFSGHLGSCVYRGTPLPAGAEGYKVELNDNFRSNRRILEYANAVFDPLMTLSFGDVDYKGTARLTPSKFAGEGEVRMRLIEKPEVEGVSGVYSVKEHYEQGEAEAATQAAAAVDWIKEILAAETVSERDKDGKAVARKAREEDVAVLVRSSGVFVRSLTSGLKKAGIRVAMKDEMKYESCVSTAAVINYLRLIDNRRDDVTLAGVMISPFGGFDLDELADIRLSHKGDGSSFCEAVEAYPKSGKLYEKIRRFEERLDVYEELAESFDVAVVAGRLVSDYAYFETVYAGENGRDEAAVLSQFLGSLTGKNVSSVSRYVRSLSTASPKIETSPAEGVKIMTVHASKGLEFPFVILADVNHRMNVKDASERVLVDERLGLCGKFYDQSDRSVKETSISELASLLLRRRQLEEEMRVLYVALTRAKEKLFILGSGERKREKCYFDAESAVSYLDWLLPVSASVIEDAPAPLSEAAATVDFAPSLADGDTAGGGTAELTEAIAKRLKAEFEQSGVTLKTNVTSEARAAAGEEIVGDEYKTEIKFDGGEDALARGTAYHKFMELMPFEGDLSSEYDGIAQKHPDAAKLVKKADIVKAAEEMWRFTAGAKVYRELPFVIDIGRDGATSLLQGVIDLMVVRGEGRERKVSILDYKTTRASSMDTPEYVLQTEYYAQAAEKILGLEIGSADKYIYSFYLGKSEKLERVKLPERGEKP